MKNILAVLLLSLITLAPIGCVTTSTAILKPTKIGQAVYRQPKAGEKYGYLEMETDRRSSKPLPRFAMWTSDPKLELGWGYIRLTNTTEVEYLREELGVKFPSQGNWGDFKYAPGTLPIYDDFTESWLVNGKYTKEKQSEFLVVVELSRWWWR